MQTDRRLVLKSLAGLGVAAVTAGLPLEAQTDALAAAPAGLRAFVEQLRERFRLRKRAADAREHAQPRAEKAKSLRCCHEIV